MLHKQDNLLILIRSQSNKMSKEAQKEKQEKEFRHFQDKFLKRGRSNKSIQLNILLIIIIIME